MIFSGSAAAQTDLRSAASSKQTPSLSGSAPLVLLDLGTCSQDEGNGPKLQSLRAEPQLEETNLYSKLDQTVCWNLPELYSQISGPVSYRGASTDVQKKKVLPG
ncbi:hypothetical protein XENORESO_015763 [Xenotaenia resolanae]|uniref:Uncharacterized protein n=1 Tax=Xenotaenia resolanae TaxID=208358 RepID=A0ABV0WGL4_9TELE